MAPEPADCWRGARVRLRAVEPADWPTFFAWNQDSDSLRRSHWVPFPQSAAATQRWAEQLALAGPAHDTFRWMIENSAGAPVGTINSHSADRRNGTFSYGLGVAPEHQRQGYASEAIILVLRYFFAELRYQKVTVEVVSFNTPSRRLHERLGFQCEAQIRRLAFTQGQYFDHYVYGLTAEEFLDRYGSTSGL
ncbi:MAG TPA: GNAT family N-acetyltransferase [Chloroflexia bacterium]|nr:GNAT family N-acetyltransferase [Chloroflexia bacterium]